jgi:hypothetical protein
MLEIQTILSHLQGSWDRNKKSTQQPVALYTFPSLCCNCVDFQFYYYFFFFSEGREFRQTGFAYDWDNTGFGVKYDNTCKYGLNISGEKTFEYRVIYRKDLNLHIFELH